MAGSSTLDSDSAFLKVYGFDIQVVSASWGTERAEVSCSEQMWCLRLDPKLTAYNQGNGCRAQTIWMYAKGVRVEREDQYMDSTWHEFSHDFPIPKTHSSGHLYILYFVGSSLGQDEVWMAKRQSITLTSVSG